MKPKNIILGRGFAKQMDELPSHIETKLEKLMSLFQSDPAHLSLRLHKLSGKLRGQWSISIDRDYRIIFRWLPNGVAMFISVGTHAIYS